MDLYLKGFVIGVATLCGLALYWMLAPFWDALAWGICLAFLLAPLQRWLTHKLRGRDGLSAGIITVLVPLVLAGPLVSLGVAFANQFAELVTRLQKQPLRFDLDLLMQLERYPLLGSLSAWLRHNFTTSHDQLQGWLDSGARLLLQSLASTGGQVVLGTLDMVIHFFMMLFLLFFLLRDGRVLLNRAVRLVPMEPERRGRLLQLIGNTTRAVVYGTGLTALAQGVLVAIGFAISGLPSPAVLTLALMSQWGWAIFMLVWGVGVSVSDNLLRPLLISSREPVSMLAVFIGVIGGLSAFGMIGIIIGPVLLTVMAALLRFVDETLSGTP